jgi:hypothetical protein
MLTFKYVGFDVSILNTEFRHGIFLRIFFKYSATEFHFRKIKERIWVLIT